MKIVEHLCQGILLCSFVIFMSINLDYRGSVITIDDIQCSVASKGEWTANRIELEKDYEGENNMDAMISVVITEGIVNNLKKGTKKNSAVPVSSVDISHAIEKLNSINPITSCIPQQSSIGNSNRSLPLANKKHITTTGASVGDTTRWRSDTMSDTSQNGLTSSGSGNKISPRFNSSNINNTVQHSERNTTEDCDNTLPMADVIPSPAVMLQEISSISPNIQMQKRREMNVRMANKV